MKKLSKDIEGFLEFVSTDELSGWVVSQSSKDVDFVLRLNDTTFDIHANWCERNDVAEARDLRNPLVGFVVELSGQAKQCISQALQQGGSFEVLANGISLPKTEGVIACLSKQARQNKERPQANIEAVNKFVISGWAVGSNGPVADFELFCNGCPVEFGLLRKERQDVVDALKVKHLETGFEIEVPGYVWEISPEQSCIELQVRGDGFELSEMPIAFDRCQAAEWVTESLSLEKGQECQYQSLLALEHAHYGKLLQLMDQQTARDLLIFARQMNLEDFLSAGQDKISQEDECFTEEVDTLLLWKALRLLNQRLGDPDGGVYSQVIAVVKEMQLSGVVKKRYLLSAIPLLCRSGELAEKRMLLTFDELHSLISSENLWEKSLSLALLVADGSIPRATKLFAELPLMFGAGWLSTECIHFSINQVQYLEADGQIDLREAENFRYAFVDLIDAFKGDYFSRLHDEELIDAMVSLLSNLDRYTDYHRHDLVVAAIRNYGLCPTFWQRVGEFDSVLRDNELAFANSAWSKLSQGLGNSATPLFGRLDELLEPINYFIKQGNCEVIAFEREIVSNCLNELNRALTDSGKDFIEHLLSSNPLEALRIAAFPLASENKIQSRFPEIDNQLLNRLRLATETEKSFVYNLQCESSAVLQLTQYAAKSNDLSALESALGQLEKKAVALSNSLGCYLGASLLASAYIVSKEAGLVPDNLLMHLKQIISKVINETNGDEYLPAPILSSFAKLSSVPDDYILKSFLRDSKSALSSKFGSMYDFLFSAPPTALPSVRKGYQEDILVVIYSCRKYLDTRVKMIRDSWVQDLKKRGIPYLFLVGDGEDTFLDDVLALNVSDRYEGLPQKTLKMLDWVFHNSDVQFVLKIDDDCYLDVARFFDTLSYRKHLYYGRVISRAVGSMDRTWHHSKSESVHGKKVIDKSPEPSIYADGGGGYCLSRFAIKLLLDNENTPAGKRLVACSFMEDKLVGDLLALSNIKPSNEDYESYQRRRTFGDAMPVGMWENTFYPCRSTPTKMVHLDTEKDLHLVRERSNKEALWPKKIWGSFSAPEIRLNSNQLELLTDPTDAGCLLDKHIMVVSVVRNEMSILPHFLKHYRDMGVECFIIVDNCSDDGSREYLYSQNDVVLYSTDTEYRCSHYGVAWQQAVLSNHCLGKWVLLADADEFFVFSGFKNNSLEEFVTAVEAEGANALRIDMIDMYPYGDLEEADFNKQPPFEAAPWFDQDAIVPWRLGRGWFSNVTGCVSHLRHRMISNAEPHDFVSQKYALFRYWPWVRLSQGLHYVANIKISSRLSWFAHFKYHKGLKEKVETEILRGQHYNNAAEYRRYATMLAEGKGGFGEEGISTRYEGVNGFVKIPRVG